MENKKVVGVFTLDNSGNGRIDIIEESLNIEDGGRVNILWKDSCEAETPKDVVD